MDFYEIASDVTNASRPNEVTTYANFLYLNSDLVCKGNAFFAYWDGRIWQTNFNNLVAMVDAELYTYTEKLKVKNPDKLYKPKVLNKHNTNTMTNFLKYLTQVEQSNATFNNKILFANDEPKRDDYATHILPYNPTEGPTKAFDELFGVLYDPVELNKILWFVGALLSGEMHKIQKFLFLYGGKGTGKGTILQVIKKLFDGYYASISLYNLTASNNPFATSEIQEMPLLIDEECDLSRISNDTHLLKLTAHEPISINSKYKKTYDAVFQGLLIAASNERFKVKHIDSGITRRGVVAEPSKRRLDSITYRKLLAAIDFEVPAIAHKAMEVYNELGITYFDNYVDIATLEATDHIFAFIDESRDQLGDPVTLKTAAELYKTYLEDIQFDTTGYKRKIKQALLKYYEEFDKVKYVDTDKLYNVYSGFKDYLFTSRLGDTRIETDTGWIKFDGEESILDILYEDNSAQKASSNGVPLIEWAKCTTKLRDIDTKELHFVKVDPQHIVIDFDLRDINGDKSLKKSLEIANTFPETYAEVSKSGQGLHLHYIFDGDTETLSSLYDHNIEIKVFKGGSSLRRLLTLCNTKQISHISTGLPLKEENRSMYNSMEEIVWTERKMRTAVERNLRKEYHDYTRPSIDFIAKIFKDAQEADLQYDLTDMRQAVLALALTSTNQQKECMKIVSDIIFSTIPEEPVNDETTHIIPKRDLWSLDVEVYKNVFIVVAKQYGIDNYIELINPSKFAIEDLLRKPFYGFNNLRYDNHILYGALMGEDNMTLYNRSQRIMDKDKSGFHSSAYNASYLDIYEMSTDKKSLKKWEAELGIKHDEMDWPWDEPLPEHLWSRAAEYCRNDVNATEVVFDHIEGDYDARLILAEISGLPVNAKTQQHTAAIIFGSDRYPQSKFVSPDLAIEFPGYTYSYGKSDYKGIDPSEGGYVYAEPGVYTNVELWDVVSEHPNSLININHFGPYTKNFKQIVDARVAVKNRDFELAGTFFNGALKPYLTEEKAEALAYALKIAINIVYGMTSAPFDNIFKDPKNKDNVVAKRGALFMIEVQLQLQAAGAKVVHVKTDSVKVVNPTDEHRQIIKDLGEQFGYDFDHEATYEKMALVNDAVYVAKVGWNIKPHKIGIWEAIGAQFKEPYVYKKLFSKEELFDEDFVTIKNAKVGQIYINDQFVGKVATIYASVTGYDVMRVDAEKNKTSFVTGTKNRKWRQSEEFLGVKDIDMDYYDDLCRKAIDKINTVGAAHDILEDCPTEFEKSFLPF